MDPKGRIWPALDCGKDQALRIADLIATHPAVGGFKVNRLVDEEAFRLDGEPMLFSTLADYDKPIWADLKLHDVPRTVAGRIKPYVDSGDVQFITVMAKGGEEMMRYAVAAGLVQVSIIAVTELTSLSPEEVMRLSGKPVKQSVVDLAGLAVDSGVEYLVCSAQELEVVRAKQKLQGLKVFVPGVTPAFKLGLAEVDQKRTATPQYTFEHGASAIVVGGALVGADDPALS